MQESNSLSGSTGLGASEQPLYEHDCEHCTFLGLFISIVDGERYAFDLYHHAKQARYALDDETVIARFGGGHRYYSGMHFAGPYTDITGAAQPGFPMLVEAKRRAVALGLIGAQS